MKISQRIAMFILVTVFSGLAIAHSNVSDTCGCMMSDGFTKQLNLSDEQQTKIKAIKDQLTQANTAKTDEMTTINNQLNEWVKMDKLDETKLDTLIQQKKEVIGIWTKNQIMAKQQIYAMLTPEQKAKYESLKTHCPMHNQYIKKEDIEKIQQLKGVMKQLQ